MRRPSIQLDAAHVHHPLVRQILRSYAALVRTSPHPNA